MDRYEANLKIMRELAVLIEAYPTMRFLQLLVNCDVLESVEVDGENRMWLNGYNVESSEILEKITNSEPAKRLESK